MSLFGATLY